MSKTVLITGGSRGIGRATALLCAERGWNIAISYVGNKAAAEQTRSDCQKAGGQCLIKRCDIAHEEDIITLFAVTRDAFGSIDAVVNNAGIVAPAMRLMDMDVARMQRIFDTNVLGAYIVAREAARNMARSRDGQGGVIVNVSSMAAKLGSPNEYVDYAGSKGAMDSMTIGLSKELGPEGIRVNAVRPGIIETDIHATSGRPNRAAELGPNCPLGRTGTAEEVAESIIWLMEDSSSFVTGALIDVSGGR
ncbi:SDR family oxidoreductase [Thalassospira marina]|uniref:NAD(P)-dependent oxidoreductase n=1 Tax=Thalassospira marina TaxID=2048283 RepID=A0A2N3KWM1_9PROT|nr:SDR family oxidoreductase [Thalassospira marina]AUG53825.1 NAD(P)-dependent oxidoreductase [Thalassospira marina]PKR54972.1 NAD(P)-dependent oxidoreductase [Thalassospira marina]